MAQLLQLRSGSTPTEDAMGHIQAIQQRARQLVRHAADHPAERWKVCVQARDALIAGAYMLDGLLYMQLRLKGKRAVSLDALTTRCVGTCAEDVQPCSGEEFLWMRKVSTVVQAAVAHTANDRLHTFQMLPVWLWQKILVGGAPDSLVAGEEYEGHLERVVELVRCVLSPVSRYVLPLNSVGYFRWESARWTMRCSALPCGGKPTRRGLGRFYTPRNTANGSRAHHRSTGLPPGAFWSLGSRPKPRVRL